MQITGSVKLRQNKAIFKNYNWYLFYLWSILHLFLKNNKYNVFRNPQWFSLHFAVKIASNLCSLTSSSSFPSLPSSHFSSTRSTKHILAVWKLSMILKFTNHKENNTFVHSGFLSFGVYLVQTTYLFFHLWVWTIPISLGKQFYSFLLDRKRTSGCLIRHVLPRF